MKFKSRKQNGKNIFFIALLQKRFHSRSGFGYGILLYIWKMPHFRPFTALFGGFEGVFSCKNDKSAIRCPTKTEVADFVLFKECNRSHNEYHLFTQINTKHSCIIPINVKILFRTIDIVPQMWYNIRRKPCDASLCTGVPTRTAVRLRN
ncbi:MAG: hypothetical protein IKT72_00930 [Clostridia bacterium]|nr:hypothetical protein [Clostridia bacterium]